LPERRPAAKSYRWSERMSEPQIGSVFESHKGVLRSRMWRRSRAIRGAWPLANRPRNMSRGDVVGLTRVYPLRRPQVIPAPQSGHGAEGGGLPALSCSASPPSSMTGREHTSRHTPVLRARIHAYYDERESPTASHRGVFTRNRRRGARWTPAARSARGRGDCVTAAAAAPALLARALPTRKHLRRRPPPSRRGLEICCPLSRGRPDCAP
jgi:hypothetical protein